MSVLDRLPTLPEWVRFPRLVWFVIEGVVLGLIGVVIRDFLGPLVAGAVTFGNIVFFVGSVTAIFGALAWLVLVALNR